MAQIKVSFNDVANERVPEKELIESLVLALAPIFEFIELSDAEVYQHKKDEHD